jgi:hypothetical protein
MGFERITHLCGKRVVLSFGNSALFSSGGRAKIYDIWLS